MEKVIVGALIAVLGWLVTHFSKLHFEKRAACLNRVNEQLKNLYGPLMATLTANNEIWEAFSKKHWPSHGLKGYFGKGKETLSDEELSRWRTWMVHVFHPLNERIERVIIENVHLIEGDKIPESFTKEEQNGDRQIIHYVRQSYCCLNKPTPTITRGNKQNETYKKKEIDDSDVSFGSYCYHSIACILAYRRKGSCF